MTKSMTIVGLLMLAVALGCTGCAATGPPPIPNLKIEFPAPSANTGETSEVRTPSLIPGVVLETREGECAQEYAGLADSYTDAPIGNTGYRWEQITVTKHRVYQPCTEKPDEAPASAPAPAIVPSSSLNPKEPPHARAQLHRPPARLWRAPSPHHGAAPAPTVRGLWRYGEVVRV